MARQIGDKTVKVTRDLLLANRKNGSEVELKDRKKSVNKITSCDPLTGLQNKDIFFDCLTRAIALAARNKKTAAVLFICVDSLKLINDTLGENSGINREHFLKKP